MTTNWKEIAKFFSGIAAHEVIIHSILATSDLLPLKIFGFQLTSGLNIIVLLFWLCMLIVLPYCAWMRE